MAQAGMKRLREESSPPSLDLTLERVARHLAEDAPGQKLEKAAEIMSKLLVSSLKPDKTTSSIFVSALVTAAANTARIRDDDRVASILLPVFAAAEELVSSFHADDRIAVKALALRCVHLRRIRLADEALEFNRLMRPVNDALQSLGPELSTSTHAELFCSCLLDCLQLLLDLNERRSWAQPTVRAAFRIASQQRHVLVESLRSRLDGMTHLLHARQTAAAAVHARSYAGVACTGAGAGAMSGKHHPLVNTSGGGLASSARGAAVIAVPGVRALLKASSDGAAAAALSDAASTFSSSIESKSLRSSDTTHDGQARLEGAVNTECDASGKTESPAERQAEDRPLEGFGS